MLIQQKSPVFLVPVVMVSRRFRYSVIWLRRGHLEVSKEDFLLIARAMKARIDERGDFTMWQAHYETS